MSRLVMVCLKLGVLSVNHGSGPTEKILAPKREPERGHRRYRLEANFTPKAKAT